MAITHEPSAILNAVSLCVAALCSAILIVIVMCVLAVMLPGLLWLPINLVLLAFAGLGVRCVKNIVKDILAAD